MYTPRNPAPQYIKVVINIVVSSLLLAKINKYNKPNGYR
jgi:hypothetical protein